MENLILHKNGAYNIYTTIADGACFETALTLDQLTEYIKDEFGASGLRELPARLERAHKSGCSSHFETLEQVISINAEALMQAEFIERYLTLPPNL